MYISSYHGILNEGPLVTHLLMSLFIVDQVNLVGVVFDHLNSYRLPPLGCEIFNCGVKLVLLLDRASLR